MDINHVRSAYNEARACLLAHRNAEGFWNGELSSSALATATAIGAFVAVRRSTLDAQEPTLSAKIEAGIDWLVRNQNVDGGWGDTDRSFSNISTTMLCRAAFYLAGKVPAYAGVVSRCEDWLQSRYGIEPEQLAQAVRERYGTDRTFAVPILMMNALAGLIPWQEIPRLPFELACLPQSWYRFARMPVVSYALPALIAIGQCIHHHRGTWNPVARIIRRLARARSLRVLETIQPASGGYLEATPLTSFVIMALASSTDSPVARRVISRGIDFVVRSARADGSWPIDSNLSIWLTTLAVNALAGAGDLDVLADCSPLVSWLCQQQLATRHPYTGADPGAWGWSHLSGSVPDCDDTPGAMLALTALGAHTEIDPDVFSKSRTWILKLQNRDGGWPTFCRGWGLLPFDRSGCDLTAHALRALRAADPSFTSDRMEWQRAFLYLARNQRQDGSWLPLWFGNQHAQDDANPVYGTVKVLAAYRDCGLWDSAQAQAGIHFLLSLQNVDGGWGGAQGTPSSTEETALVVELLSDLPQAETSLERGLIFLAQKVTDHTFVEPSPIGFYFAKLWYYEKLYPIIFTVAALGRSLARHAHPGSDHH